MIVHSAHKTARRNRRRVSAPASVYTHAARPLRFGDERFRVSLLTGAVRSPTVTDVTDMATDWSWDDASSELSGQLTLTVDPDARLPLTQSNGRIRLEWTPQLAGPFERLWTMKVSAPERSLVGASQTMTLDTSLTEARRSRDDYRFKRDKHHPRGWTADEIARAVAKRVGLPLGRIARCHHRIVNLTRKQADPLDMIVLAYRQERRATGRRFFMSWDGTLNIDPLTRSPYLLDVAGAVIDASYKAELADTFATTLTVTATAKAADDHGGARVTKHRRRKIRVQVRSAEGIRTYGYVHRTVNAPDAQTEEQARRYGSHVLAKAMKPKRTLTVTLPFMPRIRRGDAFQLFWQATGLTQVVWVAQAAHTVSGPQRTTQITAAFDDPYADPQRAKDEAARKAKARAKGRSTDRGVPSGPTSSRGRRRR